MSLFFSGTLKIFLSVVHIFTRTYNLWPWKSIAGRKLLVPSPSKILEIPHAIEGNAPSLTDHAPMENCVKNQAVTVSHLKSLYQFVISAEA